MNKAQIGAIIAAVVLFSGLYFGFDTKPSKHKAIEKTRSLQGESTSFQTLLEDASAHLSPTQAAEVAELQKALEKAGSDQDKIQALKKLSGKWYDFGEMPVAGGFAEQVAELENADSSWSVAGGTYFNGIHAVKTCISDGITSKMNLAIEVAKRAGLSRRNALSIIEKYTGSEPGKHHWNFAVRERGAKVYSLLDPA